jgi:hypothetical protein
MLTDSAGVEGHSTWPGMECNTRDTVGSDTVKPGGQFPGSKISIVVSLRPELA